MLVTGGTGVLGRQLVPFLDGRAEVKVLSRRLVDRPGFFRGDLDTGEGAWQPPSTAWTSLRTVVRLPRITDGRSVTSTGPDGYSRRPAASSPMSCTYRSSVWIGSLWAYYRAKLATEDLIRGSGVPWTVLRTTQFHDLVLMFVMLLTKGPFALVPHGFRSQPVDVGESPTG